MAIFLLLVPINNRMLRTVLNVSGKIRERRMRVAEHCVRRKEGGWGVVGGIECYVVAAATRTN